MHSRVAIIAFAAVAISAPSVFAVPAPFVNSKRDVLSHFSRELAELHARQESGALSWQDVEDFGNKVLDGIQNITPVITQGVDIFNKVKGKRDLEELMARQVESGALSWQDVENFGNKVLDGIQSITPIITEGADIYNKVTGKRDGILEARAAATTSADQSGALSWQDVKDFGSGFVKGFTKTAETVLPIVGAFVKREDLDNFTRDVLARQDASGASGAISWQDVKDFGSGFVKGFTKTAETLLPVVGAFVKREEADILARDLAHLNDLLARQESGAISWQDVKDFGSGFVKGFTKTAETVLPIVGAFVKREDMDMLMLARAHTEYVRSLNELD
ncbi:hypothetical protein EUX98_g5581 [Antrodiella citrinella]|uniref:Uncharacterized protein n=1 Tax=Antrodiella citrinella TaxID=2447956 RepID=A0A4S4MT13_9APHY|nr:hypothetical protein EUX98_g5581 [Antrodiella citrinella]